MPDLQRQAKIWFVTSVYVLSVGSHTVLPDVLVSFYCQTPFLMPHCSSKRTSQSCLSCLFIFCCWFFGLVVMTHWHFHRLTDQPTYWPSNQTSNWPNNPPTNLHAYRSGTTKLLVLLSLLFSKGKFILIKISLFIISE